MTRKALILIDPLKDFCPGGALAAPDGDRVIPVINRLMRDGDYAEIILVNETHPPDHISFASRHGEEPFTTKQLAEGWTQTLWPDHCVEGTAGVEPHDNLDQGAVTHVFRKGQQSDVECYSAFRNVHGEETGLFSILRDLGVEAIDVAGIATDYCVRESVLDACRHGSFKEVRVILDACAGIDANPGDVERALMDMREAGAVFVESGDILATRPHV